MGWIKKNIWWIILATLVVSTTSLVIYGIATHTEPTFLSGCWINNQFSFNLSNDTDDTCLGVAVVPHWPKDRKITIGIGAIADQGEYADASYTTQKVVAAINSRIGFELLEYGTQEDLYDILVLWNSPVSSMGDKQGKCRLNRVVVSPIDADRVYGMQGLIIMGPASASYTDYRALYHELGHCALALDHDPFESSAMYYEVTSPERVRFYQFTDYDVTAIKEYYGK